MKFEKEMIETITELLIATKDMNSELHEGWDDEIEKAEALLKEVKNNSSISNVIVFPWKCKAELKLESTVDEATGKREMSWTIKADNGEKSGFNNVEDALKHFYGKRQQSKGLNN